MERCLVGTEVHVYILLSKSFPKVNDVTEVCDRDNLLVLHSLADTWDEHIEVLVDLVNPALVVALVRSVRVDLRTYAHNA